MSNLESTYTDLCEAAGLNIRGCAGQERHTAMIPNYLLDSLSKRELSILLFTATHLDVNPNLPYLSVIHRAHAHWGYTTIKEDFDRLKKRGLIARLPTRCRDTQSAAASS